MKDHIIATLSKYGICTTKQLSFLIKRDFGELYKPTSIGGVLRTMVSHGEVGRSNCGAGTTHYWLADPIPKASI